MPLGVVLNSFGQPVRQALESAARLALREIELPPSPEIDPAQLSRSGRRDLLHYVRGLGLHLAALGGDPGGERFSDTAHLEQRLDKTRQILELAAELHVPVLTSYLGPLNDASLKSGVLKQALEYLAEASDRTGTRIAFETGSADPQAIADLLRSVNCSTLAACYDPGSLLIDGFDPLAGVAPLADKIVLARIRDAVAGSGARPGRETAIGHGQIDFAEYLAALDQAGYRGPAIIRRTDAERPMQELADAKARLEKLVK